MPEPPVENDDLVRADIVCPCHRKGSDCHGAFSLRFPVRMFEPNGEIEYRQLRQKAVTDFLAVYDEFYERTRVVLTERDPLVIRPKRKGRNIYLIESDPLGDARHVDTEPGIDLQSDDRSQGDAGASDGRDMDQDPA